MLLSTHPESEYFYANALRAVALSSAVSKSLLELAVKVSTPLELLMFKIKMHVVGVKWSTFQILDTYYDILSFRSLQPTWLGLTGHCLALIFYVLLEDIKKLVLRLGFVKVIILFLLYLLEIQFSMKIFCSIHEVYLFFVK